MSNAVVQQIDYAAQIAHCQDEVHRYQAEVNELEQLLQAADAELEEFAEERAKYELLSGVAERLEQLHDMGASKLFWDGLAAEDQVEAQLSQLRDHVDFFERRIKKITDKQDTLRHEINDKKDSIEGLLEEIIHLQEAEEESKYEYLVEREIKPLPYQVVVMPWTKKGEDENKFRLILIITIILALLLGWLIPLISVPEPERKVVEIPERLAKLIKKEKPKPPPKKKPKKEEKQPEKKKPTEKERKDARERVKNKGVLAFSNNLADLLEDMPEANLGAQANLNNAGATAKSTRRNIITSGATSSSGGIQTSALSRDVAGSGKDLSAVGFSRVESAIGTDAAEERPLSSGPGPARTDEEIQIVFDKYKAALYRIYNRELRSNPTLQGKIVLRIRIEPNGSVSLCKIESSDMDSPKLLKKIVARVKKFNFGAKEGVPRTTILYPIDFLPAS